MTSSPPQPPPPEHDRLIAVGVPIPGLGLLTYRVPEPMRVPAKGARVRVPVSGRVLTACVVHHDVTPPDGSVLRDIVEVLDEDAFLPASVVELALWVGEYYASGPGDALAIAMPPGSRDGKRTSFKTEERIALNPAADAAAIAGVTGARQRGLIDLLRAAPAGLRRSELARQRIGPAIIRALIDRDIVLATDEVVDRDPFQAGDDGRAGLWTVTGADDRARGLTDEQTRAYALLRESLEARAFKTALLHGVTGSGKTELYLRLAADTIAAGLRVLVLVPEIALTPAVAGLFRALFGDRVAIQHSGLSDGERHDQWHLIRRGGVDVVVGTRSAVFAPIERVGLVVVDEEHDGAYKQEESPRYNGRDVAIVRAQKERALIVLGSATPSLESAANARAGRYMSVVLTERVMSRPMAAVRVVDMRKEYAAHGADVTLSAALIGALGDRLDRHEQSLVLLNRRGFATVIFCRQCGASMECPHCSVSLTYHRGARRVRCHYCNFAAAVPRTCGECGGEFLEQSGFGTERIENDLRERFPAARIARVDRDTVRRRGAIARILSDVKHGAIDILVGTQMIAKGHDFPDVTLVGVVSADVGLGLADFRASERTFQLLTQVVGRSGRGETPGEAIVQTLYPDHYSIRAAAAQDYAMFFDREIEFRRDLHYPPTVALINVIVKGRTFDQAMADAQDLVTRIRHPSAALRAGPSTALGAGPRFVVIGPAPAAMAKIKDEYRAQFFLKGQRRKAMRAALTSALDARPDLKRRVIVDVDPTSVL